MANVMEVHPAVPANNVAEFIAHAKANPGKINFASGGVGTSPHQYQPRAAASAALSMQSIDVDLRPALPSQSPQPTQPSSAYT